MASRSIAKLCTWLILAIALLVYRRDERTDAAEPDQHTNVIIILADDLGYGDLGCYGHPRFKTPRLDRMAAEGARLTHFNAPMPFCAPSRASLLTGRYPTRFGLTANPTPDLGGRNSDLCLPHSERTLAELFHQAGYATGMVGKWHLGHARKDMYPTHRGFDDYLGILYSNDMRPVQLIDGEQVVEYPVVQATLTKRYTERAIQFLERNKSRPFFFYFAHAMPHKPLAPSEEYYKRSGAGLYGDVISELDASVGQVLDTVQKLGLDHNTLVVFTSDNGPWYGGSTGGLRGMKGTSFEGGYRVPFIARWPGRIPAGHVSAEPAVMMDLFTTALNAAGLAVPGDRTIDGADIMPLLTSASAIPHQTILGLKGSDVMTIRNARWKLHVLPAADRHQPATPKKRWIDPRAPDGVTLLAPYEQYQPSDYPGVRTGVAAEPMALFDLLNDPGEQHNVAASHPDVVKALKSEYDKDVESFGPLPKGRRGRPSAPNR
jgi:uncharacterized sulfatase